MHGHPAPRLAALALVHGYTTAFWWSAAIFAGGAVICGALLRRGPLAQPGTPGVPGVPTSSYFDLKTRHRRSRLARRLVFS